CRRWYCSDLSRDDGPPVRSLSWTRTIENTRCERSATQRAAPRQVPSRGMACIWARERQSRAERRHCCEFRDRRTKGKTAKLESRAWATANRLRRNRLLGGVVPNGFDVMAVRIDDEGREVSRGIVAISGSAVVFGARGDGGSMKRFDLFPIRRLEGQVGRHHRLFGSDPEVGIRTVVKARRFTVLHILAIAEGRKHLRVEGLRPSVIAHLQGGVCNHTCSPT